MSNSYIFWLDARVRKSLPDRGVCQIIHAPRKIETFKNPRGNRNYQQRVTLMQGEKLLIRDISNRGKHNCYIVRAHSHEFEKQIGYCDDKCYRKRRGYIWTGIEISFEKIIRDKEVLSSKHMVAARAFLRRRR